MSIEGELSSNEDVIVCILCQAKESEIISFYNHLEKLHCVQYDHDFIFAVSKFDNELKEKIVKHYIPNTETENEIPSPAKIKTDSQIDSEENGIENTEDNCEEKLLEENQVDDPNPKLDALIEDLEVNHGVDNSGNNNLTTKNEEKMDQSKIDILQCKTCEKTFADKNNLKRHSLVHSGSKEYSCEKCKTTFMYSSSFKRHQNSNNCKNSENIGNKSPQHLLTTDHSENADNNSSLSCHICQRLLSSKRGLRRHIKTVHKTNPGNNHMIETEKLKVKIKTEVKEFDGNGTSEKDQLVCGSCQREYKHARNLKVHIRIKHKNIKTEHLNVFDKQVSLPYKCKICEKKFQFRKSVEVHSLSRHKIEYVNKSLNKLECASCKIEFSHLSGLRRHNLRNHIASEREAAKNTQVSINTDKNNAPNIDHKSKVNSDKFPCSPSKSLDNSRKQCLSCEKSYAHSSDLKRHVKKIHQENLEEAFDCSFCKKSFQSKLDLNIHESLHQTGDKPDKSESKIESKDLVPENEVLSSIKYQEVSISETKVPVSENEVVSSEKQIPALSSEMPTSVNNDKKVYSNKLSSSLLKNESNSRKKCLSCEKSYAHSSDLRKHVKKIHKKESIEEKFDCNKCKKSFQNKHYLIIHEGLHESKLLLNKVPVNMTEVPASENMAPASENEVPGSENQEPTLSSEMSTSTPGETTLISADSSITKLSEALPEGWRVKAKVRSSGLGKQHMDRCYFSPSGQRFRSIQSVIDYMRKCPAEYSDQDINKVTELLKLFVAKRLANLNKNKSANKITDSVNPIPDSVNKMPASNDKMPSSVNTLSDSGNPMPTSVNFSVVQNSASLKSADSVNNNFCKALPTGWKVREYVRANGRTDRWYLSPSGQKFTNSQTVVDYMRKCTDEYSDQDINKVLGAATMKNKANLANFCKALPEGWKVKEKVRSSGVTKGHIDRWYFSPSGQRFTSTQAIVDYMRKCTDEYSDQDINKLTETLKGIAKTSTPK